MPIFEWHPAKAAKNFRERHLAFEEAVTVFDDDRAIDELDPDPDEERFKILGACLNNIRFSVAWGWRVGFSAGA